MEEMSVSMECYEYVDDAIRKAGQAEGMADRALERYGRGHADYRVERELDGGLQLLRDAMDTLTDVLALLDQQVQDEG